MFTTNFALTNYTVASDIESEKIDAYLLVVDSEGIAVDSAVAGRKLTAEIPKRKMANTSMSSFINSLCMSLIQRSKGFRRKICGKIAEVYLSKKALANYCYS